MILQASKVGAHAEKWAQGVFDSCSHPEQGYRMVLGMLQMRKTHPLSKLIGLANGPMPTERSRTAAQNRSSTKDCTV